MKKKPSSKKTTTGTLAEPAVAYNPTPRGRVLPFPVPKDAYNAIDVIRKGLPMAALTGLMQQMEFSLSQMAVLLHTSERTLRRYEPKTMLNPEQTERLLELQKLYARGAEVLGSDTQFRRWMGMQLLAFGGKAPQEFMDTSTGIGLVLDELGRIEHGVLA